MRHLVVTALAVLTLLSPILAQSVSGSSPSDVHLTIKVRDNQLTFHIGEVIPLELAFTSNSRERYQLDMASYDRSGRLNEDKFVVEPSKGWDDPLDLYYRSYLGFIGGGLRGSKVLSSQPAIISLELNEWVRFKEPGRYRVKVLSGRVFGVRSGLGIGSLSVSSNELTLTIVLANKEWQDSTLKAAAVILDSSRSNTVKPKQDDPRQQAIKTLRYLGSADAAREMARRITGSEWDWNFEAGLVGSPARSVGLEEMEKLLIDPNFPVTDRFLGTMSVLALPEDVVDNVPAQREKAEAQFRQDLISAIGQKRGAALAVSNNTIVEDAAIRSRALPADLKRTLTRELVSTFDKLPIEKQAELLQYRWPALDHEEMLPLLRKVATRYQDFQELQEMNAFQFNNASAAALTHWYEIAPDEARPIVIQEILRPKPRFNASVLGILPDKEMPEADQALAEHLNSQPNFDVRSNVASLIHRYASPAVEPQVTAFLDRSVGKLECAVQEPLLAYILKVDPEAARPRLEAALAARGEGFTACNHSLLSEVAKLQNHSMLQDIAINGLDDPDPQIVGNAATYLMDYGSKSAEDVLWSRLTQWSDRWKGRENQLQYVPRHNTDGQYEMGAGSSLMQALATGHGWFADEPKLRRLVDLSIGPQQRQQAEQYLRTWRTRPWSIQYIPFDKGQFQIVQYHERSLETAEEKLLQFPHGSTFEWFGGGVEGEAKAFQELSRFATEHGIKLVRTQ